MSEQDIDKITGAYYREIQTLKREIAALVAWISSYREATKAIDAQLHEVVRYDGRNFVGKIPDGVLKGEKKVLEYPVETLIAHVAELSEKRTALVEKERLLAGLQ